MYLIVYAILGSIPLLAMVIRFYWQAYVCFFFINGFNYLISYQVHLHWMVFYGMMKTNLCGVIFLLGFLIKLPIFGVHIWLPKAHVEATTEGSMILARILLKMGLFGILRVGSSMPTKGSFVI